MLLKKHALSVTLDQLAEVPTPEATETWQPVPHATLAGMVRTGLAKHGYSVAKENFCVDQSGHRMFGVYELSGGAGGYTTVFGLRNSHDKKFPAGLCVGSRVMVCSNLAFSSEITIARKHTSRILDHLPVLMDDAMLQLRDLRTKQDNRIAAYKACEVSDARAHDFAVRSIDMKVLPVTKLPALLEEWRRPRHDEFAPRTAWSLFNSYTELFKSYGNDETLRRSRQLHTMMDSVAGLC